jgi:hypothetical protein
MQIINFPSAVSVLAAGVFALMVPQLAAADTHWPGQGYDVFHSNVGEPLPTYDRGYMGTSMKSAPTQGFEIYNLGNIGNVPASYEATSMMPTPGQGWDVFHSRSGDPI